MRLIEDIYSGDESTRCFSVFLHSHRWHPATLLSLLLLLILSVSPSHFLILSGSLYLSLPLCYIISQAVRCWGASLNSIGNTEQHYHRSERIWPSRESKRHTYDRSRHTDVIAFLCPAESLSSKSKYCKIAFTVEPRSVLAQKNSKCDSKSPLQRRPL